MEGGGRIGVQAMFSQTALKSKPRYSRTKYDEVVPLRTVTWSLGMGGEEKGGEGLKFSVQAMSPSIILNQRNNFQAEYPWTFVVRWLTEISLKRFRCDCFRPVQVNRPRLNWEIVHR